jgi:ABC-type transport system involved in multi-copper enzyme maturation permease subunit
MYLRLWWKDARQFWPIWSFLVLAAGLTQILLVHFAGTKERGYLLVGLAMGWTCLYAFAVGAAAFAGERETGTLRLLDVLPASRRVVWLGKVSFALVSTIGLALILLALAVVGTPTFPDPQRGVNDQNPMRTLSLVLTLSLVIGQAMAWGLFCSAILPNALLAAVLAIVLTSIPHMVTLDGWFSTPAERLAGDVGLAVVPLVASLIAFTWGRRRRRLPLNLRLRSPIEVTWTGRRRASADRPPAPVSAPDEPAAPAAAPTPTIAAPRPVIAAAQWTADRPRPRSRAAELWSLIRQTLREGRSTWLFLLALGLVCPALFLISPENPPAPFLVTWNAIIALAAGASVFGLENRRRTYRFLVHHGARPGLVWLAKLATWCFGMALIWAPLVYLIAVGAGVRTSPGDTGDSVVVTLFCLHLPLVFAVAVLCGMAISRGITAGVVALVIALLLALAQGGLLAIKMMPTWGLAVLPLAFLAVTWAWSGDWLLDRPAPGRWVRLGLMLAGVLAASFGGYTAWRAWSVADVGPIPMPSAWAAASTPLPDDRDAAPLYREAARRLNLAPAASTAAGVGRGAPKPPDLAEDREALDLIRRASARPDCRLLDPGRATLLTRFDLPPILDLADAVGAHARGRLASGDLAAAWDDILILLRMARHMSGPATMHMSLASLAIERPALELAQEWARAPGQTPDRLHAALSAYRGLPAVTPPAEIIRGEGLLVERSIDLPVDDLVDWKVETTGTKVASPWELLVLDLIATPWERARARRVNRLMTAEAARLAAIEPWQRPAGPFAHGGDARFFEQERHTLLFLLQTNAWSYEQFADRTEVERRAVVYVLAVREWQLRHDGRFPDRLQDLVPDVLPSLPTDPYSGRPFLYTTFAQALGLHPVGEWPNPPWPPDTRLIYSVGLNGRDDHGQPTAALTVDYADIVFPAFPAPAEKKGQ